MPELFLRLLAVIGMRSEDLVLDVHFPVPMGVAGGVVFVSQAPHTTTKQLVFQVPRQPGMDAATFQRIVTSFSGIGAATGVTLVRSPSSQYGETWTGYVTLPTRALRTLSYQSELLSRMLADLGTFLTPTSAAWYAERGIRV